MVQDVAFKAEAARSLFDEYASPARSLVDNAMLSSSYAASSSVGRALMLTHESNLAKVEVRTGDGSCGCGCNPENVVAAMAADDEVVED
jgi:hypothetical protein